MPDQGFAIRCPRCRQWSMFDQAPSDVTMHSVEEFKSLLQRFRSAQVKSRIEPFEGKLFFCQSSRLLCPAPFEAVVYERNNQALEEFKIRESWSFTRHFKLYRTDTHTRWDNESEGRYCGILFNTQPVRRLRHIEIESLMDRELVSHLIAGICTEIDSPLTIFAANTFEPEDKSSLPEVHWMPIEGYSQERQFAPPRYSLFCNTCRDLSMKHLTNKFGGDQLSIDKCPLHLGRDGKCMSRDAACMRDPKDWNHCPAFLDKRKLHCPCYNSDVKLIAKVVDLWQQEKVPQRGIHHQCHAGFHEVAFPLVVHGHLAGVAITGQLFFRPDEIKQAAAFVKSNDVHGVGGPWETLEGQENVIEEARQILIGRELDSRTSGSRTVFLVDPSQLTQKVERLQPNLARFQKSADSHYRDFRVRSESAFRQELLGYIETQRTQRRFFDDQVGHVLARMQQFWAFKGAYLIGYSCETKKVSTIATSILGETKAFGLPGIRGHRLEFQWQDFHSCPYLHVRGQNAHSVSSPLNRAVSVIERIVDDNNGTKLRIKTGEREFVVAVPTARAMYTFVFAVRDEREVSSLKSSSPGGVSDLCQDMIFETCSEIIGEFHNLQEFVEHDKQIQARCLQALDKEVGDEMGAAALHFEGQVEDMLHNATSSQEALKDVAKEISQQMYNIVSIPAKHIKQRLVDLKPPEGRSVTAES